MILPEKLELVELVRRLAAAGRTEPEIIGQLRAAGFRPVEINLAMKKVYRERIEAARAPRAPQPAPAAKIQPQPEHAMHAQPAEAPELASIPEALRPLDIPGFKPVAPQPAAPAHSPAPAAQARPTMEVHQQAQPDIGVEELVEEVVAESLKKMEERLNDIDRRDAHIEEQLAEARKLVEEARGLAGKLDKSFASHTDEFKEFLEKFEARISALENAFRSLSEWVKK